MKEEKKGVNTEMTDSDEEITNVMAEEDLEAKASAEQGDAVSAELKELEGKLKEMEGKYLRAYADFDNYRKRVAKEKEDIAFLTTQRLLRNVLEVKDHLELALEHAAETPETKAIKEGVGLTLKQLEKFLEASGVKELNALGELFDPNFHEAIQQEKSVEYKPGTVVKVYQKGYLLQNRLLRPARVVVAA